ncbi:hypothetical protein GOBAR_DD21266 [Gossypium barbadense]|nr:hypothetical protein GOBAR_DD21266 [Gossypium barbadense]
MTFLWMTKNRLLEPKTSGLRSAAIADGDLSNVLVELRGSLVRYKDLQRAFGPYLEKQLHSYQKVVGEELSERMVYSPG